MELRAELRPPRLDERQVANLTRIAAALDGHAGGAEAQKLLAAFNDNAGTELSLQEFQGIYGGMSHETWVRSQLLALAAKPIPNITRAELVELVRRVMEVEGPEHEVNFYLALVEANVPCPSVSELIFWPSEEYADLTSEDVIDRAMAYGPTTPPRSE